MSGAASAPSPLVPALPRLTTTVPREYVHRAAVAEVLLTGWRRQAEDRFRVTAQWPRGHSFFTPLQGLRHDPMLVAETVRQIGSLLAHAEFDVPLGYQFLMWHLDYSVVAERLVLGDAPAELELDVVCSHVRRRGGMLAAMRYEVVIRRDGEVAATGSASYTCTSPEVYRRLRGPLPPGPPAPLGAPVPPRAVGRLSPFDVVLSAEAEGGPGRWLIRADQRHPILFDHPVDHIPGMVLLEAARQAACALAPYPAISPTALTGTFRRYAELTSPCRIEAERDEEDASGSWVTRVNGHQDGELLFTCSVTALGHTASPADPSGYC
ncbi:ScbA/BarX family gamma-butyrolactone biosynthesis protein [Streptomyces olivoverticillatus]|uniref:ScbA/BarX family gamma-butyrolactone biosynthesis protein n=1 Tax=Streptomyces olivoverticillatus TaxID=66427 RepID=UPI0016138097|nr:ScbA/BarX family gamma-butyrolactone biosynthesis protein [Streptomyces olivoverticillatus]